MRILLITPLLPLAAGSGSQQRTYFLWKALGEIGQVDILVVTPRNTVSFEGNTPQTRVTEVVWPGSERLLRKLVISKSLTRAVTRVVDLTSYDVICGRYLYPISMIALPSGIPTVVDLDDYGFNYDGLTGSWFDWSKLKAAGKSWLRLRLEQRAMRRFRRFWFVTDHAARRSDLPGGVLRNIPRLPERLPGFEFDRLQNSIRWLVVVSSKQTGHGAFFEKRLAKNR